MPTSVETFTASQAYEDYDTAVKESVFGGENDLWGNTAVTRDQLLSEDFTVGFDIDLTEGNNYYVDSIEIEVFYANSLGAPPPLVDPFQPDPWADSCVADRKIVLVGKAGRIAYSEDFGETWVEVNSPVATTLWKILHNGRYFYASGDYGTLIRSSDGVYWTSVDVPNLSNFHALRVSKSAPLVVCAGTEKTVSRGYGNKWIDTNREISV